MTAKPDPQIIVEQLLLAHFTRGGMSLPMGLGSAGYGMLRAAGLKTKHARAVNVMVQRVAKQWRADKVEPSSSVVEQEATRLLI